MKSLILEKGDKEDISLYFSPEKCHLLMKDQKEKVDDVSKQMGRVGSGKIVVGPC